MPNFTVPVHEANDCHTPAGSPAGGQFCAKQVYRGIQKSEYMAGVDPRGAWFTTDPVTAATFAGSGGIVVYGEVPAKLVPTGGDFVAPLDAFSQKGSVTLPPRPEGLSREDWERQVEQHMRQNTPPQDRPRSILDIKRPETPRPEPARTQKDYPSRPDRRPSLEAMADRATRDGFRVEELEPVRTKRRGTPGWYRPVDGEQGYFYHLRRDGRVSQFTYPLKRSEVDADRP